jgi:phenylalanyl-tRNA synthetase beta chain
MKLLVSWLRDFVDVPGSPEQLAQTMSVRGFAVEGIERVGNDPSATAADAVLDFEVTANRPDCMSVLGMAREVATAYGVTLKPGPPSAEPGLRTSLAAEPGLRTSLAAEPGLRTPHAAESGLRAPAVGSGVGKPDGTRAGSTDGGPAAIAVTIEDSNLCWQYVGAVAHVTVGPSPAWMQLRLQAAGIRPISNIVDVTNYVLLELGQPMHAFDLARLTGAEIRVRTARAGEQLRTLDAQTRSLSPEMLVIADAKAPVAIAGVMGGADSEVTSVTRAIVLESAYFNPLSVRRTSKKLGLKTEASMRFERGTDPAMPGVAMKRALALLETISAGAYGGMLVDQHPTTAVPVVLTLRRDKIRGLLGHAVPDADVQRILQGLGFALQPAAAGWTVTVPTWRVDAVREVDLIEEVARHYGFDRLPTTFPVLGAAPRPIDPRISRARQLRNVLTGAGFSEAVTFGFVAEAAAAPFAVDGDVVPIANPLSETFAVLRPSALPGLVDAVSHNRRREQRDVRLFEIGARFSRSQGERRSLACAWTGMAAAEHWSGSGRNVDFFDIKGVVERICEVAGVAVETTSGQVSWLTPGRAATASAQGTSVAVLGELARHITEAHGLPADPVYVADIDLDALDSLRAGSELRVAALPRYPSVTRDISVLVDNTLPSAALRQTIRDAAPSNVVRIVEFDRYQGKGIPVDKVSISYHLTFRSSDRTLTDSEVQAAMDAVLAALKERHAAVQR